jgi:hypothetical protein
MVSVSALAIPKELTQPPVFVFVALYCCQAVLLTEDVDIIVQHLAGVLQSLAKKQQGSTRGKASSPECSALYGEKTVSALPKHLDTDRWRPVDAPTGAQVCARAASCILCNVLPHQSADE